MIRLYVFAIFIAVNLGLLAQGSLKWEFLTKGRIYSSPAMDENYVFIGSNDSCLYALNKKNGVLTFRFKTKGEIQSKPLLHKETVIFNSADGLIYCLDKSNAKVLWTFKTEGEKKLDMWDYYLSSPICSNNTLFVGSGDGNIYAINPETGKLIWEYNTGNIVHATPTVYNQKVLIGGFNGYFYALDERTGELVWKFRTVGDSYFPRGEIQKGAVVSNNKVIFGSRDFNIYALNVETGRGMWNMKEKGSWVIAKPLVLGNKVYFGTSDSHRFCGLNIKDGHEISSYKLNMRVYGEAVDFNGDIYFGCFNGKLYRINQSDKKLKLVFQTHGSKKNYLNVYKENEEFKDGFELYGKDLKASESKILDLGAILSTPIIENGVIYFGDSNGVVYAYQLL